MVTNFQIPLRKDEAVRMLLPMQTSDMLSFLK